MLKSAAVAGRFVEPEGPLVTDEDKDNAKSEYDADMQQGFNGIDLSGNRVRVASTAPGCVREL